MQLQQPVAMLEQQQFMDLLTRLCQTRDQRAFKAMHSSVVLLNSTTFSWRHGAAMGQSIAAKKPHERGRGLGQLLVQATSHGLQLLQQQATAAGAVDLQLADTLASLCDAFCNWVGPQIFSGQPQQLVLLYRDASGILPSLAAVCPPLTAHLQQLRTQRQQHQQAQQQQQQHDQWQQQLQECDAAAKLAVYVLTAWHQIFKAGTRLQQRSVLDKQSCKQQLLPCAALAAAPLQSRPAVKWSLDDDEEYGDNDVKLAAHGSSHPSAHSSSSSDTCRTRDQHNQQQQQQQQRAPSWQAHGLRPASGNSLWIGTEARLIRHLDGAAYGVADLLRCVLEPLVTSPPVAVDKWYQLLLDSADVQLLLQASMAARLELAHLEMKGTSSVLQQPSLARLLEGGVGTSTAGSCSSSGSSRVGSSSSSSGRKKKDKQRKSHHQQQQQQRRVKYMQVPPHHTQLLSVLGIPAFELRWATTPGAHPDTPTPPGTHDRELSQAVLGATMPSVIALRAVKTAQPGSRLLRDMPTTGGLVALKLQRGVAQALLLSVVEAVLLGAGPLMMLQGIMVLPDLAAAALKEAAAAHSSSSSSSSSDARSVLDAVVGLLGPAVMQRLQADRRSSSTGAEGQQKMPDSMGTCYVHLLMTCRGGASASETGPGNAFNGAWQRSLLQQPLLTCQLLEAVTRSCSTIGLEHNSEMAKQAMRTAQQLLEATADLLNPRCSNQDASSLQAAMTCSPALAEQLFLFVVSQLKLLRGFYRMHASSSSLGLMLQGWQALSFLRKVMDCILQAAAASRDWHRESELRRANSSSSSGGASVAAAPPLWPFAAALVLRDASEMLQLLLQGHGLPPTHRADVLVDVLISISELGCWLGQQLEALQLPGGQAAAALEPELSKAESAVRSALPAVHDAQMTTYHGDLPLHSFSAEELRQLISAQVVQQLADFSTAAAAALPLSGEGRGKLNGLLCNSPSCSNMQGLSEQQLVAAGTKRCSACHCAVYCCKECQLAHWKMGHRQACKRMTAAAAAAAAAGSK